MFDSFNSQFNFIATSPKFNVLKKQDFVKVIRPTDAELETKWDDTAKTCKMVYGYNIQILTSVMGFHSIVQNYVLGAKITPITGTWSYSAGQGGTQSFTHKVFLNYQSIIPEGLLVANSNQAQFFVPTLPKDLFYPISVGF